MHIILIGAPGAGKGTQAGFMAAEFQLAHVASGDMFRESLKSGTLRGRQAKAYLDRGELVPDTLTVAMVMERLRNDDCKGGVLLDGFPRNTAQAEALDRALTIDGEKVNQALYLSVAGDQLLARSSGRSLCRVCQASYHKLFNPPQREGACDKCGGELYQRDDDQPETARRRLEVYFEQTTPIIDHYRTRGVLDEVDGSAGIDLVRDAIFQLVRRRQAAL